MERLEEISRGYTENEKEKFGGEIMEIYEKHAPTFLEKLEEKFPWHLRYPKVIFTSITLIFLGLGFLFGYLLETEEEARETYNY